MKHSFYYWHSRYYPCREFIKFFEEMLPWDMMVYPFRYPNFGEEEFSRIAHSPEFDLIPDEILSYHVVVPSGKTVDVSSLYRYLHPQQKEFNLVDHYGVVTTIKNPRSVKKGEILIIEFDGYSGNTYSVTTQYWRRDEDGKLFLRTSNRGNSFNTGTVSSDYAGRAEHFWSDDGVEIFISEKLEDWFS
jgi:hypothetical protein